MEVHQNVKAISDLNLKDTEREAHWKMAQMGPPGIDTCTGYVKFQINISRA